VLASCNSNKHKTEKPEVESKVVSVASGVLPIGVVNSDTILEKYKFAIAARDRLTQKAEDAHLTLNMQARNLQNEMDDFQKKIDNHAFLSRERAEQEAARLQKKQSSIQEHGAKLENEFMVEQQKLDGQLKDSINLAINELNKNKRFSLIMSTSSMTDNVLYTAPENNVTAEILAFLNSRCK
jgi:outer membrane protein